MRQSDSRIAVKIIRRPARRRMKRRNLPFLPLLVVFGLLFGALAVTAGGGLQLLGEDRGEALQGNLISQSEQRNATVPLSAVPTPIPRAPIQEEPTSIEVDTGPTTQDIETLTASLPLPASALLAGMRHEYQWWNNCAPSSVGMILSYYGRTEAQAEIAPILKPDPNDKNVSPHEIAAYVELIGFRAHVGVGGDLNLLKKVLAAGFPVMVEFWFEPEPDDGMGHYRVLFGYDDQSQSLSALDSFLGPNVIIPYPEFDAAWHVFNRTYIVIYPQSAQAALAAILDESTKGIPMWQNAFQTAQEELTRDRNNAFAWFNLATSALNLGDTRQAAEAFDWARQLGLPWRMFWYQFGPFEAYLAQGRYQEVIALAEAGMRDADIEEWYFWRGRAREMTGDQAGAQRDYIAAIELNANFLAARNALDAN